MKIVKKYRDGILIISASIVGAVLAYLLQAHLGFNSVIGASVTGIIFGILFPSIALPGYMGAFVGMVAGRVIGSIFWLVCAAIIAALLFIFSKRYFKGFGGKLGFLAFISILLTVSVSQLFNIKVVTLPIKMPTNIFLTIVFILTGAIIAYLTNLIDERYIFKFIKTKYHNRVLGSAMIGLVVGLVFPVIFKNIGLDLAVLSFAASFVGMTSHKLFKYDWEYLTAGAIAGLVFAISGSFFPGFGGKAGSIAFVAVVIFVEIYLFIKKELSS